MSNRHSKLMTDLLKFTHLPNKGEEIAFKRVIRIDIDIVDGNLSINRVDIDLEEASLADDWKHAAARKLRDSLKGYEGSIRSVTELTEFAGNDADRQVLQEISNAINIEKLVYPCALDCEVYSPTHIMLRSNCELLKFVPGPFSFASEKEKLSYVCTDEVDSLNQCALVCMHNDARGANKRYNFFSSYVPTGEKHVVQIEMAVGTVSDREIDGSEDRDVFISSMLLSMAIDYTELGKSVSRYHGSGGDDPALRVRGQRYGRVFPLCDPPRPICDPPD